ncbi:DUF5719 family protein [Oryzobacter sp. R7]|uniref:DUF5719 family protein n=1 Tax=Oryzobacter faecalis TaxID=3388656 RepID=UPI00398C92BC
MTRLATARARTVSAVRAVSWAGVARVVVVGGAAAGLVYVAAGQAPGLDLAAAVGEDEAPVASTALTTRVAQVCPGPELTGIPGVPDVSVPASVTAASGPADLLPADPPPKGSLTVEAGTSDVLTVDGRPEAATEAVPQDSPLRVTGEGALAPAVAAAQEWRLDGKDLRGLVSAPCGAGSTDQWLLAGGAGAGRQERLVLTNPGANPVTAAVAVHGRGGPLGDPIVETVAPGARVSVLLDGRYGDEDLPAVHVTTDGAGVHAVLTDTWLQGSTALGAESTGAAVAPAVRQVVPGVVLGIGPGALRVVAPGDQSAVVRVDVIGPSGFVALPQGSVLSVPAGAVAELALTGIPAGTYTVVARSDVPVTAAALSRVGDGSGPGDIAWAPAAPPLQAVGGLALPPTAGVGRQLHLVSTGGSTTLEVTTVAGDTPTTRTVSLLADRVATVPLEGASSVWVRRTSGTGELRGGVVASWGSGAPRMLSATTLRESAVSSPVSRAFPLP